MGWRAWWSIVVAATAFGCGDPLDPELFEDLPGDGILEITEPGAVGWVDGDETQVRGFAVDVDQVLVDGYVAEKEGHLFAAPVRLKPGINIVDVEGVDGRGDLAFDRAAIVSGSFADPSEPVPVGARLRLNKKGISQALSLVHELLEPRKLTQQVLDANPIYADGLPALSWGIVVDRFNLSQPKLTINPRSGQMSVRLVVPNIDLKMTVYGQIDAFGNKSRIDVSATAQIDVAEADLPISLDAEGGKLVANVGRVGLALHGFYFDTSLFPGSWEDEIPLLSDALRYVIVRVLENQLQDLLPGVINGFLGDLDLSFDTELLGKSLFLEAGFHDAEIDTQGITVVMSMDPVIPGAQNQAFVGYLESLRQLPAEDTTSPLAVSLSDDVLNRMLFEIWRAGILDVSLSTEDESLEPGFLASFKTPEGSISTTMQLPPVMVDYGDRMEAQIGGLELRVDTPGGAYGSYVVADVGVRVAIAPRIVRGELALDLGPPTLDILVKEHDWRASRETISNFLKNNLPIGGALSLVEEFSFPIPQIGGIALDELDTHRDPDGYWTNVTVSLDL